MSQPGTNPSEAMILLRRIDANVAALRAAAEAALAVLSGGSAARAPAGPKVASDFDLDGQYGDPTVAFVPKQWKGEPQNLKGTRMSECPPDFLEVFAQFKDSCAEREEAEGTLTKKGKPAAAYSRKDAALARGWARRLRQKAIPEREKGKGDAYEPPDEPSTTTPPADDPLADDDGDY